MMFNLRAAGLFAAAAMTLGLTAPISAADAAPAPYPLTTCAFSGKAIPDGAPSVVAEGREIKFCCANCKGAFEKDPAAGLAKVDAAIIKDQEALYPIDTCPISGKKLGAMGDPINVVVGGTRLVKLCCPGCKKSLLADPSKAIAKLDEAVIAKQGKDYPHKDCPMSGHSLDSMGKPVDKVFAGRLARFCCADCVAGFEKDPMGTLKKLNETKK